MEKVYRCLSTGNPFGTDTWRVGSPCTCDVCTLVLRSEQLREALIAAKAILKHREIKGMEGLAFAHGIQYSDVFAAQCKEAWEKINAALEEV